MNLFEYSAGELHKKLLAKECSAVEITESVLERIDACEEKVGAYLTVTGEQAKAAAAKVDCQNRCRGGNPSSGRHPYGYQGQHLHKGVTTTCASKMLYNFVPPYNATVMDKLEGVDAVMIGKLNMDEFAMGSSCENSRFKLTHNPRALDRVPGRLLRWFRGCCGRW